MQTSWGAGSPQTNSNAHLVDLLHGRRNTSKGASHGPTAPGLSGVGLAAAPGEGLKAVARPVGGDQDVATRRGLCWGRCLVFLSCQLCWGCAGALAEHDVLSPAPCYRHWHPVLSREQDPRADLALWPDSCARTAREHSRPSALPRAGIGGLHPSPTCSPPSVSLPVLDGGTPDVAGQASQSEGTAPKRGSRSCLVMILSPEGASTDTSQRPC